MTNANKLRIGNWVKLNDQEDGKLVKFKYFSEDLRVAFFYKEAMGEFTANIAGIELSPEILEKCGFDRNCILKISQGLNIEWSYGKEVWLTKEGEVIYEFENTQYLHQLQNLYFALCGEELNYTP